MVQLDKIFKQLLQTKMASNSILIVEDETLVGWSLATALKKIGYEVTIAGSGEEATDYLGSAGCSLVITDVKLPHLDGFQVAAAAKAQTPPIPVIMISALDDGYGQPNNAHTHIDHFVEKPFNLSEMTALVNRILSKNHNHQ